MGALSELDKVVGIADLDERKKALREWERRYVGVLTAQYRTDETVANTPRALVHIDTYLANEITRGIFEKFKVERFEETDFGARVRVSQIQVFVLNEEPAR